jgi:Flp pilus assembly protein TadD
VVLKPGASVEAYCHALEQAEEACRLEPKNSAYVSTLGMAQYRLGQYQAAVATLVSSEKLSATPVVGSNPTSLAFLAMAQYQLGQKEQAQATLTQLRETLTKPPWSNISQHYAALLQEAENLLGGQAIPAKP